MMRNKIWAVCLAGAVVGLAASHEAATAQSIKVSNGIGQPVYLWLWKSGKDGTPGSWHTPVPYITPSVPKNITLEFRESYFVVVRDEAQNDDPIGWRKLGAALRHGDVHEVVVTGGYEAKMRTEDRKFTEYETQTRTRKIQTPFGGIIEQKYRVRVPVTKTRKLIVPDKTLNAELKIKHNGELIPVNEFAAMQSQATEHAEVPPED